MQCPLPIPSLGPGRGLGPVLDLDNLAILGIVHDDKYAYQTDWFTNGGVARMAVAEAPTDVRAALDKSFYSPAEVAELASVSSSTILNYIHSGRLAAVRLSARTYRIPRKAVIRLLGLEAPPATMIEDPDAVVTLD